MDILSSFMPLINSILFAALSALATWVFAHERTGKERRNIDHQALKAIMRTMLIEHCDRVIKQGYRSIADDTNISALWEVYEAMGLNGVGKSKYEEAKKRPIKVDEEEAYHEEY